jgi:hypothetical protein
VAIDPVWSKGKARRHTQNSRMSNYRSDVDHRSSDPLGSFRAIDLKDPTSTTQLTGNTSWSDTWPQLIPCQVLTTEMGSLDEGVCGKQYRRDAGASSAKHAWRDNSAP